MKLLLPPESRRAARGRRQKRRRLAMFAVLALVVLVVAGFYAWPQRIPDDLYGDTDNRVRASLATFRNDHDSRRIDVRGQVWSYIRLGEGAEAVLFLHGLGGTQDIWWQQIRGLMDRYTVIAISFPEEPTLEGTALALRSLLDQEGVDKAHVVGTSMGGYIAQYFTASDPDRVASLVLSNTFPPGDWIEDEYGTLIKLVPLLPGWVPGRNFRKTIEESIYPASGGSQLVRSYLLEQSYRMSKADFRARLSVLTERFATPDLEALGIPAMVVEADNDPSVPAQVRAQLRSTYSALPVVTLSDVGHFPYLNRPAAYTRILEDFWTGLRGGALPVDSLTVLDGAATESADSVTSS